MTIGIRGGPDTRTTVLTRRRSGNRVTLETRRPEVRGLSPSVPSGGEGECGASWVGRAAAEHALRERERNRRVRISHQPGAAEHSVEAVDK